MQENEKKFILSSWKTLAILKFFFESFGSMEIYAVEEALVYPKNWKKLKNIQIREVISTMIKEGYLEVATKRGRSHRGGAHISTHYKITRLGRQRYKELTNILGPLIKK